MPLRAPALGPAPRQGEPPCRQVRHPSPCLVTGGGKRQGWRERRAGTRRAQNGARVSRAPAATLSAGFQREGGVQGPILYFSAPGHDALAHPAAQQAAAKRYRLVQSNFSRARCSVGGGDARTACSAWHAPPPPRTRDIPGGAPSPCRCPGVEGRGGATPAPACSERPLPAIPADRDGVAGRSIARAAARCHTHNTAGGLCRRDACHARARAGCPSSSRRSASVCTCRNVTYRRPLWPRVRAPPAEHYQTCGDLAGSLVP